MLTAEQKKAYVRSGGKCCPYCGSAITVVRDAGDAGFGVAFHNATCRACRKVWVEKHTLTEIIETEASQS